jgi:hypothetical protein
MSEQQPAGQTSQQNEKCDTTHTYIDWSPL